MKLITASLNELKEAIHETAKAKGFYDQPTNVAEKLMLIVSELSEALEADRKEKRANKKAFEHDMSFWNEDMYEYMRKFNTEFELCIKDTFEDELADAIIRILDLCAFMEIDIEWHVDAKHRYNETRPYKHNKNY